MNTQLPAPTRKIRTRVLLGLDAHQVTVECHCGGGLPRTTIVGLGDNAIRESKDRVKSALTNSGFDYPGGHIVINLAPADIAKTGTGLDLPIAIAILVASHQLPGKLVDKYEYFGELSLFGELRRINGVLACALAVEGTGRTLIAPEANRDEVFSVGTPQSILLAASLFHLCLHLRGETQIQPPSDNSVDIPKIRNESDPHLKPSLNPGLDNRDTNNPSLASPNNKHSHSQDGENNNAHFSTASFNQIIGQHAAKRALTIAAAGGHHALMIGPPGTGKTMLARGFCDLLPDLSQAQGLQVAAIYSAGGATRRDYRRPPFRDPHHSASTPSLVGGGHRPNPGEVALAHHGVLFLDELPHFKPAALNLLREPIESGEAVISRANYKVRYPCQFQLIAAMNPCPAGRSCREDACRCTTTQVQRYQGRISGPLLDRIDIHVRVPEVPEAMLITQSADIVQRDNHSLRTLVTHARAQQWQRQGTLNVTLSGSALKTEMRLADVDQDFLTAAIEKYQLSARSFHKLWRIARTIADLADAQQSLDASQTLDPAQPRSARHTLQKSKVEIAHLTEALSYRSLDWERGVS